MHMRHRHFVIILQWSFRCLNRNNFMKTVFGNLNLNNQSFAVFDNSTVDGGQKFLALLVQH